MITKSFLNFLKHRWILILICSLYIFLGLFRLDQIPGEIWGDAIAHYNLVEQVKHGNLFYNYAFGGDGPMYTYLALLVSYVFGLSFDTLKLTSVLIGACFVMSLYFFALQVFKNKTIAYIASTISAISFWTITFARQPHARILVPLFITLILFFTLRKKTLLAGLLLGLGMYTQASIWGLMLVYLAYVRKIKIFLIGFLLSLPLMYSFYKSPTSFFSANSYYGEKLAVHTPLTTAIHTIGSNSLANALSFTYTGDPGFRMNIPHHPFLDAVSGLFFLVGFCLMCFEIAIKRKLIYLYSIILPFLVIQIPSLLDIHNSQSQPNIGRMIGVLPLVYLIIGYGMYMSITYVLRYSTNSVKKRMLLQLILIFLSLGSIFSINFYNYYYIYPKTLPNNNTPFGKIIAQKIDSYPRTTSVYVIGSGWGEWGQPEIAGIPMVQKTNHITTFVESVNEANSDICVASTSKKSQVTLISNPAFKTLELSSLHCVKIQHAYMIRKNRWDVAWVIEGSTD